MSETRTRIAVLVSTALAIVVLGAGCASSGGPQAGSPTSATRPPNVPTTRVRASGSTATTQPPAASAATRADLAALTQQLDAAGSSLGAANAAIAQSDPNQTKNEEGSAP